MATIRLIWVLIALFASSNSLALEGETASPIGETPLETPADQAGQTAAVQTPSKLFSGFAFEAFAISTSASGSGTFTLAHKCYSWVGWANCVEQEGQFEDGDIRGSSLGIRIIKKSTSDGFVTFDWGMEVYPASFESNYLSVNSTVFALYGRAMLDGLQVSDGWGVTPYFGFSLGPTVGSLSIRYPGMLRPAGGDTSGGMGCLLLGLSVQVATSHSLFFEGRVTRFASHFPKSDGQYSVTYGDSAEIDLQARQLLLGWSYDF